MSRGTATPLPTGPFAVVIPDTAGMLNIPGLSGSGGLDNDLLPWTVNVDVLMIAISQVNFDVLTVTAGAVYRAIKSSSGAQNDEINFDVVLAAGTWTFELIHRQDTTDGIYTVQINGSTAGTIDGYAASSANDVRTQITGISVTSTGKVRLKLLMATKNGSASAYTGAIQHIQLKRTA